MNNKFEVFSRYQYRVARSDEYKDGIRFCDWFSVGIGRTLYDTKEEAEQAAAERLKSVKNIDRITKLRHEYKVVEVDAETKEPINLK